MRTVRLLASLILIGVGFAAGATWSSQAAQDRVVSESRQPRLVDARGPLTTVELEVTELFEEASPSVVNVTSRMTLPGRIQEVSSIAQGSFKFKLSAL